MKVRNCEGHKDKIRGKFKPKVRGPKKQATEQFSNNLTQEVEQKLQNIQNGISFIKKRNNIFD